MSALETRIQIIYLNHHWRRWMAWKKKHLWALKPCVIRIIWHLVKCDAIHHPFSMLYKLGMLGIIPTSLNREGYVTQEFLDSTKVTYITGNDLLNVNNDCIYVLHPALTKSIDKLQRKKIKHFNLFVLGKGMSVPQDKLMQLVADYRNNTIKKSDFDSKYYSKQMKKD